MPLNGLNTMNTKLSEFSSGKEIYSQHYHSNFETESDIDTHDLNFAGAHYQVFVQENWFEGIHISMITIQADEASDFTFSATSSSIGFLYCLDGQMNYYDQKKIKNLLSIKTKQQYISNELKNHGVLEVKSLVKLVYIQLTESYFKRVADVAFHADQFHIKKTIAPEMELLLQSLTHSTYTGRVKRLFIESKIFELIIFYINQKNKKNVFSVKKEDVDKVLQAKFLIESNIQKPFSLVELSRKVGINDFKLKKGFKEITGFTVFGYLYKIRMQQAHYYLSKENKAVNEVSFLVGYKNPQHFISAFKKMYFMLPGRLNKTK